MAIKSVKYIGVNSVRRVLRDEWEQVGIHGQDAVEWNKLNGWTVMGDKLNKDAIEALEADGSFVFIRDDEEEENKTKKK